MFGMPNVVNIDSDLRNEVKISGRWYTARPIKKVCFCLLRRLKLSWLVFTGKYDVVYYQEDLV